MSDRITLYVCDEGCEVIGLVAEPCGVCGVPMRAVEYSPVIEWGPPVAEVRYVADQTENGDPMVFDLSTEPATVMCVSRSDYQAELIAAALNTARQRTEAP